MNESVTTRQTSAPERESDSSAPSPPRDRPPWGEPHAARDPWPIFFFVSLLALIGVVAFGAGIFAERGFFSIERRGAGGDLANLSTDANADAAFPRLAEVKRLIEEEYYYRPRSSDDLSGFRAELDQAAVGGMATAAAAAATPGTGQPPDQAASATAPADIASYLRRLEDGALHAMTEGLADDYTGYFEPVVQGPIAEGLSGQYEGIGIRVQWPDGRLVVVEPIPGSPAEEAGLLPGDEIEAADGTSLRGLTDAAALVLIRGPSGTEVRLTIRRPGQAAPFDVVVERRAVILPSVSYQVAADGRVAWIQIALFSAETTDQLDDALAQAKEAGVAGVVLDLRGNTGGYVFAAQEAIGRFLPAARGPALYEDIDPADNDELLALEIYADGEEYFEPPLVVLIDGGTASASEIVAGALRDYGRAALVGTPSFGKGLVQKPHDFADGSSVRITYARWLTPNKTPISEEGIAPDILVEPLPLPAEGTPIALPLGDPQLERAVTMILAGG